jgi:Fe-S cluster assembly scaffold protein SufB
MRKVDAEMKAKEAVSKKSPLGPDIDLDRFTMQAEDFGEVGSLKELPEEFRERSLCVGLDARGAQRAGSFFQADHTVMLSESRQSGLEVMSTGDALEQYGWLADYWWQALEPDSDKYTAQAEMRMTQGYFLRAMPGVRVEFPLQACMYMTNDGLAQNVHNIIIAEEGSELNIITGCTTAQRVRSGLHVGISEFYVKKDARVTFTMIHNWAEDMAVRPRSAAIIDENGVFMSNYVCMKPVRTLQMYPAAYCNGQNSVARFNTVLFALPGSSMDVGARVYLREKGSRAEVVTRAITGGGDITARGHLIGNTPEVKGHLECRGLILSEQGMIHAVPELEGKCSGVDLSHEAAVGKIAEEEIRYLMARGLNSDEATAAIVRGFLDVEIKGLPENLKAEISRAVRMGEKERFL